MGIGFSISNKLEKLRFFALALIVGASGLALSVPAQAAGQTCTWTGAGADNKFSTVANWEDCGGGVPITGDKISFPYESVAPGQVLINDLDSDFSGVILDETSLQVDNFSPSPEHKNFSIERLSLQGGSTISYIKNDQSNSSGFIMLSISDVGGGPGNLVVKGDFTKSKGLSSYKNLKLNGELILPRGDGYGSSEGYYQYSPNDTMSKINIGKNSSVIFDLYNTKSTAIDTPIWLEGGKRAQTGSADLSFRASCEELSSSNYRCIKYFDTEWTLSGDVTLESEVAIHIDEYTTVRFTGNVNNKDLIKETADSRGHLVFGDGPAVERQPTSTSLEGDRDEGYSVRDRETATLLGKRSSVDVYAGGLLKGTGVVSGTLLVDSGGTVAPGLSPGCLTVGQFWGREVSEYEVELGGGLACSEHDKIVATGIPGGTSPVWLTGMKLSLYGYGDFVQAVGDKFIIIDNQTSDPVEGTFKDLPEGAEIRVGDAIFTISYVGGDGNDVELTAVNSVALAPKVPNTGFSLLNSSNLAAVIGASIIGAASLLLIRRKIAQN